MFLEFLFCFFQFTSAADFSVGSYNVHNQKNILGLPGDVIRLHKIDVLALQEVMLEDGVIDESSHLLLSLLKANWNFHCLERVNQDSEGRWESLALYSRHPILKCGRLPLEHTGSKKRVAQWAQIEVPNMRPLLVINTDHETNSYLTMGFPDRKKQVLSLVQHLKTCAQWLEPGCETWPTVITGDFNTNEISLGSPWATRNEIQQTISLLQTAHLAYVSPCPDHEATFSAFWVTFNLDHIFIKNLRSSCRQSLKNRQGSDHLPIWSTLHQ